MLENFRNVIEGAIKEGPVTICVAAAQDPEVLEAVKKASDLGIINAILVGDEKLIKKILFDFNISLKAEVINEPDTDKAGLKAAEIVHNSKAQILVKGMMNSSNFLRSALNPEVGLRKGKLLIHIGAYEIPGEKKLLFILDGAVNIAPSLSEKREILISAVLALHKLGIKKPNVAVLTANELVNPKMPATVDAMELVDMWKNGEFPDCIVEGPIALDVAANPEAGKHKGIESRIAGDVDIFLVPTIEAGNMVGKTLIHYARAKIGGVIIGGTHPIVLVSRSDNAEAKLNSIALACMLAK